ncbi:CDP-alcohol phosphatidyltransferase family protein [Bacteroidales bacterium OttesenSCG-928-I14]|nr:CDP-alcohol phosphatidyltransferase family protein [Bacteroidales bacterium OttesenSCG-928-I14]
MEQKPSFESSLKSKDTNDFLDLHFYRPIGYRLALFFHKLKVTPNQITIASIFIGIAGGICFYYENLWISLIGILCMIWANAFDCADGQLARMTNQKSSWGRILDGAAGDLWFIAIYLAIVFRLWPEWDFCILILGAITGYCHTQQALLADYYKNLHLLFQNGKKGSELHNSKSVNIAYLSYSWKEQPIHKLFEWFYLNYTKSQERWTPKLQKMLDILNDDYNGEPPKGFTDAFLNKSIKIIPAANAMVFNIRSIVLAVSVLINMPWIYFVFEITVLNILFIYMRNTHEKFCKDFTDNLLLKKSTQD